MNNPGSRGDDGKARPLMRRLGWAPTPALAVVIAALALAGPVFAADSPVIRAGSELEFRPYCFTDKDGQPTGFGPELLKTVADKMGLRLQSTSGPWDTIWNELVAGKLDVLPVVARTPGREPLVDFSLPHTETFDAFFVREGQPPLKDLAAASGKEIVVLRSDAAQHQLLERKFSGKIIPVESIPDGQRLIAAGKHDALLCSKLIGVLECEQAGIKGVVSGPLIPDYKRTFSFAVRKGHPELLEKLNQGLRIVRADGTYDRLYGKWLGDETTRPPKWQQYFWRAIGILGVLVVFALAWVAGRKALELDQYQPPGLTPQPGRGRLAFWRYALAVVAVAAGHVVRVGLEAWGGQALPTFITYYPAVMVAALLGGIGPGLLATALATLAAAIWLMPQWAIAPLTDFLSLSLFCGMGLFMTAVAEAYRRGREKAAAFLREANEKLEQRVTERTAELSASHERYRSVVENTTAIILRVDPTGVIKFANGRALEFFGYTADEFIGHHVVGTMVPPEDTAGRDLTAMVGQIVAAPDRFHSNANENMCKDGRRVWVEWTNSGIYDAAGKLTEFLSVGIDATERKRAEEKLREGEARYRSLFEHMLDGLAYCRMLYDEQGRPEDFVYLAVNDSFGKLTGLADVTGKRVTEVIPRIKELNPELLEIYGRVARTGQPEKFEIDFKPLSLHLMISVYSPVKDYFVAVFNDITERKRAEAALRESEERFRVAQELSPDGFLIFRPLRDSAGVVTDFLWIYENDAAARMNDTDPKGVCGKRVSEVLPHHNESPFGKAYKEVAETGEVRIIEEAFYDQDTFRQRRCFRVVAVPTSGGDVAILVQNVTERKNAEEAMREREERLRLATESARIGTWDVDLRAASPEEQELKYSKLIGPMFGEAEGFEHPNMEAWANQIHPEDRERVVAAFEAAVRGEREYDTEFRAVWRDGTVRWILTHGTILRDSTGRPARAIGIAMDITERKRTELDLEQARMMLTQAEELGHLGSWQWKAQTGETVWSEEQFRIYGLEPGSRSPSYDELMGKHFHPEDAGTQDRTFREAVRTRSIFEMDFRIIRPDGTVRFVHNRALPQFDANGELLGYLGAALDITERKRVEEALHESHDRLAAAHSQIQALINNTPAIVYAFDLEERFVMANKALAELLKSTPEQMIGKRRHEFMPGKDADWHEANDRRVIEAGTALEFEEHSQIDGRSITWLTTKFPLRDAQGKTYAVAGISNNISERKRIEGEIAAHRDLLETVFEHMPAAINIIRGRDLRLMMVNAGYRAIAPGKTEFVGKTLDELWPETGQDFAALCRRVLETGEPHHVVDELNMIRRHPEGPLEKAWFTWSLYRIRLPGNDGWGIFNPAWETTARMQAEEAIEASLREKDVLLKEIHHRVKNNLQVIASLVDLQAGGIKEPGLLDMFADIRDRVRSMALVHEKLYQSESLAWVDFADYMQSLLNYLSRSHDVPGGAIALRSDLQRVLLPIDKAVPCGLMVNELVSNAYKHAFRGRASGEISAALRAGADGRVCLRVGDNGVGLPAGLDWRQSRSLGLRLIRLLSEQLHASVAVRNRGGTEFEVAFEPEKSVEE